MKQLVLVAVIASIASSALTLLGTLLLPSGAPPPLRPAPVAGAQVDLDAVVGELAALRRELTEAVRSRPEQAAAGGQTPREPSSPPPSRVETEVPAPSAEGPPPPSVPVPTRGARLAATIDRDPTSERFQVVKGDLSHRWMLRDEREVLRWFGAPDRVFVRDNGVEEWWFSLPEEAKTDERTMVTVQVHAGRVISFY